MNQETLKFSFTFRSNFWDRAPEIDIVLDNKLCYQGAVSAPLFTVYFYHDLEYNQSHRLQIVRSGKDDSQCQMVDGKFQDQMLILEHVEVDGVDWHNIVLSRSWYEPRYSPSYQPGHTLETHIIGETWFGHNGTWCLEFKSPVWQWLIEDIWNG